MNLTRLFYDFIVVGFSTLISVVVPDAISQCNSKPSFPKFLELPGFFLHVIPMAPASQVLNHMECGRTCFFQTGCVSYNFKHGVSGGTNCEILAYDRFLNSSALRRDGKYSYYYVQKSCDDNPCANGGTCRGSTDQNNQLFICECRPPFTGQTCLGLKCSQEVTHGMEDGSIKDNQLSMSSHYNNDATYGQRNGRLNKKTWPYGAQINSDDPAPWFQIDLLTAKVITAVGIQGYGAPNGASWTTSYQISSSIDGTIWKWYQESPGINKTLLGNTDAHAEVRQRLDIPILARMVKIWATTCKGLCTYRLELYGCDP